MMSKSKDVDIGFSKEDQFKGFYKIKWLIYPALGIITLLLISCTVKTIKVEDIGKDQSIALLSELNSYNESVHTLEGKALVVHKDGEKTYSFRAKVFADKSNMNFNLHLDEFIFKVPIITVIKNHKDILAILHSKKTYTYMNYEELELEKLIGFNIPNKFLFDSMLGKIVIINGDVAAQPFLLRIKGIDEMEDVTFNDELLPIEAKYVFDSDILHVTFSKYKVVEDIKFPHKITISHENRNVMVNYSDLMINIPINDDVFSLETSHLEGFTHLY